MSLVDFSLGDVGEVFKDVREAITGEAIQDPNKKAEIELKLQKLEQELTKAQLEINKEEAKSKFLFVAGWRPFIGWVGGLALFYLFIGQPLLAWVSTNYGWQAPPTLDATMLVNLVLAMLGFGGLRTFEKMKKVQNKH